MKIKYKINEVKPKVFAVVIEDRYDRAMTFLRVQEFYESPNKKFRGKNFSIWDYIKWYSEEYGKGFTYGTDWSGFNIPLEIGYTCYDTLFDAYTPYDETMEEIIHKVYEMNGDDADGYIIGAGDNRGDTFQHEVCHGLYATNKEYKVLVDEITETIEWQDYLKFEGNLLDMGYTAAVIPDEIQAYLSTNYEYTKFSKGVSKKKCKEFHKQYQKVFNKYL